MNREVNATEVKIGGAVYTLYSSIEQMQTRKLLNLYKVMDEILSDDILLKISDKKLDEVGDIIEAAIFTDARIKICANILNLKQRAEELHSLIETATKAETDIILNFFFLYFFPGLIMEKVKQRLGTILSMKDGIQIQDVCQ